MKKVLLTTTALALTAGVASAEITFSGKGEAGFYRTGKAAENKGTLKSTSQDITFTSDIAAIDFDALNGAETVKQSGLSIVTAKANSLDATEHAAAVTAYRNAVKALATAQKGGNTAAIAQAAFDLEVATLDLDGSTAGAAAVKTSDMMAYSGYDLNVAASGASDNGMTFAMAFDMGAGSIADQDDDRELDAQGADVDTSALTIGYAGFTLAIGDEKVDDQYDADGWNADVSLSGSLGDLTFTIATDLDDDVKAVAATANKYDVDYTGVTADVAAKAALAKANIIDYTAGTAAVAAVYNPTSYSLGYTMGSVAFSMAGTEHDAYGNAAAKMSLTYTVSDALSATVSSDNVGTYKDIGKLSATYKMSDMLTLTASVKDDKDHALNTNTGGRQSSDVTVAYSAGAMAASFNTDESSNWWVNAKYDLGGGAQAFTTFDHTEFLVAGVNFKF